MANDHITISEDLKQQIKAIPIRAVVELMGATPVRKKFVCYGGHDTNPSLSISEPKGLYRCFGCGDGGDVITLVMNAKKLTYPEACKWLMAEFNIANDIKNYHFVSKKRVPSAKPTAPKVIVPPNTDNYAIYEWLIKKLTLSTEGLRYLTEKRGFSREQINDLEIRDLPSPQLIKPVLLAHFDEASLLASGLCKKDEKGFRMVWWDHVVIFPYLDTNLRIVNLQGRRLNGDEPKYVFLSGISPSLYNLNILNDISRGSQLLLCEGVPDTISALTLGFNAIGVPGANNFKLEFVNLLMDYDICVVPDSDKGGQKFVNNVKNAFKSRSKTIREFKVPDGNNDLNEYLIRKNSGLQ